jgi:hypothetical protein
MLADNSYDAAEDNELSFKEGDKITEIDKVDADWWQGKANGATGLFPGKPLARFGQVSELTSSRLCRCTRRLCPIGRRFAESNRNLVHERKDEYEFKLNPKVRSQGKMLHGKRLKAK